MKKQWLRGIRPGSRPGPISVAIFEVFRFCLHVQLANSDKPDILHIIEAKYATCLPSHEPLHVGEVMLCYVFLHSIVNVSPCLKCLAMHVTLHMVKINIL